MAAEDCLDQTDTELMLPFHVTGTLNKRDASCIEYDLAERPGLARCYQQIQNERQAIMRLADSLGYPSDRPLTQILTAISWLCASNRRMPHAGTSATLARGAETTDS